MARRLKNKGGYNHKVMKMDADVYALRRRVMDCIYKAKKIAELPRIEVRIVDGGDKNVCGYAYLNSNIVHMTKRWVKMDDATLYHTVLHEIVHAVTGFRHDDDCYLMQPGCEYKPNIAKSEAAFLKYLTK